MAIVAPLVPSAGLAIAAICFITFGHGFWTANLQTMPADLFPGHEVGTVAGFSGMGGRDRRHDSEPGNRLHRFQFSYAPIFLIAGLMHPMCMSSSSECFPIRVSALKWWGRRLRLPMQSPRA